MSTPEQRRRRIAQALRNTRAAERRRQLRLMEERDGVDPVSTHNWLDQLTKEAEDPRWMTPQQRRVRDAKLRARLSAMPPRSTVTITSARTTPARRTTGTPAERIAAAAGSRRLTRSSTTSTRSRALDEGLAVKVLQRNAGLVQRVDRENVVRQLRRTTPGTWIALPHRAGHVKRNTDGTISFRANKTSALRTMTTRTAGLTTR